MIAQLDREGLVEHEGTLSSKSISYQFDKSFFADTVQAAAGFPGVNERLQTNVGENAGFLGCNSLQEVHVWSLGDIVCLDLLGYGQPDDIGLKPPVRGNDPFEQAFFAHRFSPQFDLPSFWLAPWVKMRSLGSPVSKNLFSIARETSSGWPIPIKPDMATVSPDLIIWTASSAEMNFAMFKPPVLFEHSRLARIPAFPVAFT